MGSEWIHVKDRPDLVNLILSSLETKPVAGKSSDGKSAQSTVPYSRHSRQDETGSRDFRLDSEDDKAKLLEAVRDLSKDDYLAQLRWKSSRKRRRGAGISVQKLRSNYNGSKIMSCERFLIPTSMKVDHENCKYMGDSLFGTSVVSSLTSLVMSR